MNSTKADNMLAMLYDQFRHPKYFAGRLGGLAAGGLGSAAMYGLAGTTGAPLFIPPIVGAAVGSGWDSYNYSKDFMDQINAEYPDTQSLIDTAVASKDKAMMSEADAEYQKRLAEILNQRRYG